MKENYYFYCAYHEQFENRKPHVLKADNGREVQICIEAAVVIYWWREIEGSEIV